MWGEGNILVFGWGMNCCRCGGIVLSGCEVSRPEIGTEEPDETTGGAWPAWVMWAGREGLVAATLACGWCKGWWWRGWEWVLGCKRFWEPGWEGTCGLAWGTAGW